MQSIPDKGEFQMNECSERLIATKSTYPFDKWRARGLEEYTKSACDSFSTVFDELIQKLIVMGEEAAETTKVEAFHEAVEELNALDGEDGVSIETVGREDLCELCDVISTAAGLDPDDYGNGEGLASEWRDW